MLRTIYRFFKWFFFTVKYRCSVKIGSNTNISISTIFEGQNRIRKNTYFSGYMGYASYMGEGCQLIAKVGRYTSIANNVVCNLGIHPYETFVSTSPVFYSPKKDKNGFSLVERYYFNEKRYADEKNKFGIIIGNDCWIGDGVYFVGGVTIGDGAVILSRAVVTKNVPPYAIIGGVPAKVLKYRFSENIIKFLLEFKWWNKDVNWLKQNINSMHDIEIFHETHK